MRFWLGVLVFPVFFAAEFFDYVLAGNQLLEVFCAADEVDFGSDDGVEDALD